MSGVIGGVKDVFFGGAEEDAAKAQQKGIERGIEATERAVEQARGDLFNLFPAAQQNAQQGFQGALDVFGQSVPTQTGLFQGGKRSSTKSNHCRNASISKCNIGRSS